LLPSSQIASVRFNDESCRHAGFGQGFFDRLRYRSTDSDHYLFQGRHDLLPQRRGDSFWDEPRFERRWRCLKIRHQQRSDPVTQRQSRSVIGRRGCIARLLPPWITQRRRVNMVTRHSTANYASPALNIVPLSVTPILGLCPDRLRQTRDQFERHWGTTLSWSVCNCQMHDRQRQHRPLVETCSLPNILRNFIILGENVDGRIRPLLAKRYLAVRLMFRWNHCVGHNASWQISHQSFRHLLHAFSGGKKGFYNAKPRSNSPFTNTFYPFHRPWKQVVFIYECTRFLRMVRKLQSDSTLWQH